ncbi:MAG TPA: hypothetical protein VF857_01715 [Spirochaetota bacterium]
MSAQHSRPRFYGDITEDEFLLSMDTFLNGAYYPRHEVLIARASRVSEHETGRFGELVSISPFYLASRIPSFIPAESESKIIAERDDKRPSGVYCFPLRIDAGSGESLQHNALSVLAGHARAAYLSPLFFRRRTLSLIRNGANAGTSLEESEPKKGARLGATILRESAVIIPHAPLEKDDSPQYYSFTRSGEVVFHADKIERISQKVFSAHDFLVSILGNKEEKVDAGIWAAELIELMPEIFGQSASSRKLKLILEGTILEHVDEREFSNHPSVNKMLDSVSVYEKLVIIEKLLRTHLGITQYLKLSFRN